MPTKKDLENEMIRRGFGKEIAEANSESSATSPIPLGKLPSQPSHVPTNSVTDDIARVGRANPDFNPFKKKP